ncbi:NAD-dependent epimerase/dehydratase family protein [Inquilinus sp. NPDC058860]|uniref:NAD-dependent epimerase/dehydratase family protein n=1 Tax=Inquilinus sp. NPDC058860 TaxID=3346652 RepID=UPI003686661D
MADVLVIGRASFLARSFVGAHGAGGLRHAAWADAARPETFDGVGCVVNFALDPRYQREAYDPALDCDRILADAIGRAQRGGRMPADAHVVMVSTRKVYGPAGDEPLAESRTPAPQDAYGRNKLVTERLLQDRFGPNLTILRLSNIFGFEDLPGRRTFLGLLLRSLREEGVIRYDVSPFTPKDFLPVEAFAAALVKVVRARPGGLFNLGSGVPLEIGWLAMWILEGFGRGSLSIVDPSIRDAFTMNVDRFVARFGPVAGRDDIRAACLAIGKRLAA